MTCQSYKIISCLFATVAKRHGAKHANHTPEEQTSTHCTEKHSTFEHAAYGGAENFIELAPSRSQIFDQFAVGFYLVFLILM